MLVNDCHESQSDCSADALRGHWLDSLGNSILVSKCLKDKNLTAILTPINEHPAAKDKALCIRHDSNSNVWKCGGNASLELADKQRGRLVWVTEDGRRSVWSRTEANDVVGTNGDVAFPWLLNNAEPEPWMPLEFSRDILYDGARVAALLDIRQMIGSRRESQERLTHILMDHDLQMSRGDDYLVPAAESPLWLTLPAVSDSCRRNIAQRINRISHEGFAHRIAWSGENEVWVGHHKITCRSRDIQTLQARWALEPEDEKKQIEIARLLALYSVLDNPLSNRRSGVHLGIDPDVRSHCDYELFASPLNARVVNGQFASKWPQHEWRFGSIGSYPSALSLIPYNSIVCVNPPFTDAYLADVMERLPQLKLQFRLRIAVPIQEAQWRKKLFTLMPSAQLLQTYYDASADVVADVLHPTLFWEDPRCAMQEQAGAHSPMAGAIAVGGASSPVALSSIVDLQALMDQFDKNGRSTAGSVDREVRPNSARALTPFGIAGTPSTAPLTAASESASTLMASQSAEPPSASAAASASSVATVTSASASAHNSVVDSERGCLGQGSLEEAPEPEAPQLDAEEWPSLATVSKKPGRSKR